MFHRLKDVRSVWLRASSSNRDVLESSPRRSNWRCHSPRPGSCTGSSKVAKAKLHMRPLTAFHNREMEQLVHARQGSFHHLMSGKSSRRCLEVKNMQLSMDAEKPLNLPACSLIDLASPGM